MEVTLWILSFAFICILLVLSGMFSGAETALTAASRAHMYQLAREGNRRARLVNRLYRRKEHMISALLLSNNAVNTLAVALMTNSMIQFFGNTGVFYATLIMTFLIVIFAEVMPKVYAISYADRNAMRIAPLINVLVILLAPITHLVQKFVSFLLKKVGIYQSTILTNTSESELRGAIDLHLGDHQNKDESRKERAMLHSILDLDEVPVSDVMTHRRYVIMIDAALSCEEIIDSVLTSSVTHLPVWRGQTDNIIGVIHTKSILRKLRSYINNIEQIDIMKMMSKPWFIPETTTLFDQLEEFRQRNEHFALVVDEYGSLMGVLTLEDILEEIVGDITDANDRIIAGVRAESSGSYIVHGSVTIRDLNRAFEWNLPDDKASTIAGMILNEVRRIPELGQIFTFYDFRFEILSSQRHQITSLRITPPDPFSSSHHDQE